MIITVDFQKTANVSIKKLQNVLEPVEKPSIQSIAGDNNRPRKSK